MSETGRSWCYKVGTRAVLILAEAFPLYLPVPPTVSPKIANSKRPENDLNFFLYDECALAEYKIRDDTQCLSLDCDFRTSVIIIVLFCFATDFGIIKEPSHRPRAQVIFSTPSRVKKFLSRQNDEIFAGVNFE